MTRKIARKAAPKAMTTTTRLGHCSTWRRGWLMVSWKLEQPIAHAHADKLVAEKLDKAQAFARKRLYELLEGQLPLVWEWYDPWIGQIRCESAYWERPIGDLHRLSVKVELTAFGQPDCIVAEIQLRKRYTKDVLEVQRFPLRSKLSTTMATFPRWYRDALREHHVLAPKITKRVRRAPKPTSESERQP